MGCLEGPENAACLVLAWALLGAAWSWGGGSLLRSGASPASARSPHAGTVLPERAELHASPLFTDLPRGEKRKRNLEDEGEEDPEDDEDDEDD